MGSGSRAKRLERATTKINKLVGMGVPVNLDKVSPGTIETVRMSHPNLSMQRLAATAGTNRAAETKSGPIFKEQLAKANKTNTERLTKKMKKKK